MPEFVWDRLLSILSRFWSYLCCVPGKTRPVSKPVSIPIAYLPYPITGYVSSIGVPTIYRLGNHTQKEEPDMVPKPAGSWPRKGYTKQVEQGTYIDPTIQVALHETS